MDAAINKLLLTGRHWYGRCLVECKIVGAPSLACASQQRRSPRVCHRKIRRRHVRPGKRESGVCRGHDTGPRRLNRTWKGSPADAIV